VRYPFIKRLKNKIFVKLHKRLYRKELIEKIKKETSEAIKCIESDKDYYLLELEVDEPVEYFEFLNYLIYLNKNI
jgi:hypothetical protein